jgi:uncharacterized protein (TIGR02145 family)
MKKLLFPICAVLAILGCGGDTGDLPCLGCNEVYPSSSSSGSSSGSGYSSSSVPGSSSSVGYSSSYETVSYGNQAYKIVAIGEQVWFAENLNYAGADAGNAVGKCYGDIPANCDEYGRLYDWSTTMEFPSSCNSGSCSSQIQTNHKGICPSGWHIPSNADWDKLYRYADNTSGTSSPYDSPIAGRYLKAANGWYNNGNGTDKYGFSALPGGYGSSVGSFGYISYYSYWWSATEDTASYAYSRRIYYDNESANWNISAKSYLRSVRCLKN